MSTGVVGMVLARPARMLGLEAFFMELVAGIEETLPAAGMSLLLHVVPDSEAEVAAWRRWAAGGMVDAFVVVDYLQDDFRVATLQELGLPAVMVGGPERLPISSVFVDDEAGARDAVARLHGLGHRRLARVSGPTRLRHTVVRTAAMADECAARDMTCQVVEADYTERSGREATAAFLAAAEPPTAIVYDNDVMAAAGLAVATELGRAVPDELSLVAWDDSPLCRLTTPQLSVVAVDVHALGEQVGRAVLDGVAGGPPTTHRASPPRLLLRGTTGHPMTARTRGVI